MIYIFVIIVLLIVSLMIAAVRYAQSLKIKLKEYILYDFYDESEYQSHIVNIHNSSAISHTYWQNQSLCWSGINAQSPATLTISLPAIAHEYALLKIITKTPIHAQKYIINNQIYDISNIWQDIIINLNNIQSINIISPINEDFQLAIRKIVLIQEALKNKK